MGRLKTTTIKETLPDAPEMETYAGASEDFEPVIMDMSEDSGEILSRLTNVTYRISKKAIDGKMEYCDKLASSDVDDIADYLQKRHNGGTFTIRVFPQGALKPTHIIHIRIAPKPPETGTSNGAQDQAGGSIEARLLRDQVIFLQQMVLRSLESRGSSTPLGELAEAAKLIAGNNQSLNPDNLLNLVLKGMDIANKAQGGLDWKAELVNLGKDHLPNILDTFKTLKGNPPMNGSPTPTQTPTPITLPDYIKKMFDYLKSQIIANTLPVDLALDWALANASNPQYAPLLEFALTSDYSKFVEIDPDLAKEPYQSWFTSFQTGLKDAYAHQGDFEDDNTGGSTGNTGDVANHGATGKGRKQGPKAG